MTEEEREDHNDNIVVRLLTVLLFIAIATILYIEL